MQPIVDQEGNLVEAEEISQKAIGSLILGLLSLVVPVAGPFGLFLAGRVRDFEKAGIEMDARWRQMAKVGYAISFVGTILLCGAIAWFLYFISTGLTYGWGTPTWMLS
jgi:hypothetical protein